MGKSKKKYESSSSSSSSDASESSNSSSSEDVEVKRRSKKSKKSGGSGHKKHKKSSSKVTTRTATSGTDVDSVSEQSSDDEGVRAAAKVASTKKKHKKHKKQKKAKKHKKHKVRGADSEDEKRVEIVDEEMEIIEEVVPSRRHRTTSSEDYHAKERDSYGGGSRGVTDRSSDRRREQTTVRDDSRDRRDRGRDRSGPATSSSGHKHPSSKWDSPADGGEYRGRKRSHSPREPAGNYRSAGAQRGNFDEYRGKAPRSPPPRDSPARDYDRGRGGGGRGGGRGGRYDERHPVSPPPPPPPQERRWGGGDRYEDDRRDDFRKPSPRRRFDNEERRFEGGGRGRGSHHSGPMQPRERYDDYSGRDRNQRDRPMRRDDYDERGPPRRRNSSPMGGPPQRGGRDRSPLQQDYRGGGGDYGASGRGGFRDRYDSGPSSQMDRGGRFNRRGSFGRGGGPGRGGFERGGGRRGGFHHGGDGYEADHRKGPPGGGGWGGGRRSPPPSPHGSPSRSRSRERNGGRPGGPRSGGGRISSPPLPPVSVKTERGRSRSRSPLGGGAAPLPQRQPRKFPRKDGKEEEGADFEWGGKRKQPKRESEFRGSSEDSNGDKKEVEKEKPNFALSGKLTEETNKVNGVVIKYAEPEESRKPKRRWRLYPFKGEQALPTLYIHRQSCYLIGRDRKVCDLPIDHPSCSKQHAALQYRLVPYEREDGSSGKRVRPYIIDLESANGTFVNNKKIETKKYTELLEKDVLKFGFSSREYVLLHENSKEDEEDDDVVEDKGTGGGAPASNGAGAARKQREPSE